MPPSTKKDITTIDPDSNLPIVKLTGYRALDADPKKLKAVFAENMAGGMSESDFDRVIVPSGGGITWEVPSLKDGVKTTDELIGVMVYYRDTRAYWQNSFDKSGGGSPPDCSSIDLVLGIGKPGGQCHVCPLAQFGSAEKGRGQACKQMRQIYFLMPNSLWPVVVTAPPTSVNIMRNFNMRLSGALIPYHSITMSLSLEKDKNADGITYGKIVPKAVGRIHQDNIGTVEGIREMLKQALKRTDSFQIINEPS